MISIKNLSMSFEGELIFKNFNIEFDDGKITGILGPSGIGKTTLINLIAGLHQPDEGAIIGVDEQKISYIFQDPRLIPWLTVKDNLSFTLKHVYPNTVLRNKIIEQTLFSVDLLNAQDKYPDQLSGGMKQRAAIARAFAYPSEIMIMDEPFKGLDSKMKQSIITNFLNLWENSQRTVLFVTHDADEVLSIVDTVHVLSGKPADIVYSKHLDNPRKPLTSIAHYQTLKEKLTFNQ